MIFVATKKQGFGSATLHKKVGQQIILDSGSEIRDPRMTKIRIRDKHSGSATLFASPDFAGF
jgi:hypothetical protein